MDHDGVQNGAAESGVRNAHPTAPSRNYNSEPPQSSNMGWTFDPTDIPSNHYVDHYRQVNSPPCEWDGGSFLYDGKHDDFCFVCGSAMELFECQTCSSSYHAACMTPSVSPEEIPNFWFCPHCVDNELNIPQPPPSNYFTPPPPLTPSTTASRTGNSVSDHAEPPHRKVYENSIRKSSRDVPMIDRSPISNGSPPKNTKQLGPPANLAAPPSITETLTTKPAPPKTNANRPKRTSYSPPRKKSKYSAFSSDVDKALVVIHKELEAAAKIGKSENDLRDQIKVLEQGMRLKDSQLALTTRELELARKGKGSEAELRVENEQLRELVKRLNESLAGKDRELKEWREKLKLMIGE